MQVFGAQSVGFRMLFLDSWLVLLRAAGFRDNDKAFSLPWDCGI